MSERSTSSSEDLYNVPVGSFADDSPTRRSPISYDSTDFKPPSYYPGQPFPYDESSSNRTIAHDPPFGFGDSYFQRSPPLMPHVPFTSGLPPQPSFNPYASPPPAYYPYPPRNLYTSMPNNLYHNIPPSYHSRQRTAFIPSPPMPQIPRQFLRPPMVPMSYPKLKPPPFSQSPNWVAKRPRESTPTTSSIRTSPISSPRLRKLDYIDNGGLPAALRPSGHRPSSVHRVTMGGPRTKQSLQNINRMMRPNQPPNVTGKENPSSVCNCKKSRCVKLYCECFSAGRVCRGCNCRDCLNTMENGLERIQAIEHVQKKSIRVPSQNTCNCRRSACLKKYCECFQAGILCRETCKCAGCENRAGSQKLIDKRRQMKDHKGAKYAMEMAEQVWRKQAEAKTTTRKDSKPPFRPPPRAGEMIRKKGEAIGHVAKQALEMSSEGESEDVFHAFGSSGDSFDQRSFAASPAVNDLFRDLMDDDQQLQLGFFGDSNPSPTRQMVSNVMEYLPNDEKHTAMLVCKAWASLLTSFPSR